MSKDIEMINQPLLTEDGFVNEACMNELGAAIRNMPETYERLKDDPEWSKDEWLFLHDIKGALAKWAMRLASTYCPKHLEAVINYLDACLILEARKLHKDNIHEPEDGIMVNVSLCQINKWLHDIFSGFKIIYDWERVSPRSISLSALFHNVCLDIRTERRESQRFEERIKEGE